MNQFIPLVQNKALLDWVDTELPQYVKTHYSPNQKWKKTPFDQKDASFYLSAIEELSELLTLDRNFSKKQAYLNLPKFRSSYLLYFLPLQAFKFLYTFQMHLEALKPLLENPKKEIHILDCGSGPATASIALLLELKRNGLNPNTPIRITLVDDNQAILKDAKAILKKLVPHAYIQYVHCSIERFKPQAEDTYSIVLVGHLLNEMKKTPIQLFAQLAQKDPAGGILFLEPAIDTASRKLIELREILLEENKKIQFVGPCLHSERCPFFNDNKDWCHFSFPVQIESKWFNWLSKQLSEKKSWLKFSYLWIASAQFKKANSSKNLKLVLTDPMDDMKSKQKAVLICEPNKTRRYLLNSNEKHWLRGMRVKP